MQLTQALLLACSTLALAKPAPHWHGGEHRPYKSGCKSASAGASTGFPSPSSNSSVAALPHSVEPTVIGGLSTGVAPSTVPSATEGGDDTEPSSPPSQAAETSIPAPKTSASAPKTSAAAPAQSPSSTAAAAPAQSSAAAPVAGGTTYTATFTEYGAGDTFGSGNCNTATAACGWYTNPGFNAAASQNLFGVGPGAGAGPGCGLCFQLTAKTNPYNNNSPLTGTKSIVVKVNNLCPADGNPLCSQSSLSAKNSLGGQVNFDLCKDDGAAAALFGSSGVGAALGDATQVSCDQWTGSGQLTS